LVPPLQRVDATKAKVDYEVFHACGHYDLGSVARELSCGPHNAAQRGEVQVVHVRVGQQYCIDGGQLFDEQSRESLPAQQNQALGKDRVYQDAASADLQQEGGVANEGYAELFRADEYGGL